MTTVKLLTSHIFDQREVQGGIVPKLIAANNGLSIEFHLLYRESIQIVEISDFSDTELYDVKGLMFPYISYPVDSADQGQLGYVTWVQMYGSDLKSRLNEFASCLNVMWMNNADGALDVGHSAVRHQSLSDLHVALNSDWSRPAYMYGWYNERVFPLYVRPARLMDPTSTGVPPHDHDDSYSPIDHDHDADYSAIDHDHDGDYAAIDHNHNDVYSLLSHDHHLLYAAIDHAHEGVYAPAAHNHDDRYSLITHNHNADYSALEHDHDDQYAEIDHTHDSAPIPVPGESFLLPSESGILVVKTMNEGDDSVSIKLIRTKYAADNMNRQGEIFNDGVYFVNLVVFDPEDDYVHNHLYDLAVYVETKTLSGEELKLLIRDTNSWMREVGTLTAHPEARMYKAYSVNHVYNEGDELPEVEAVGWRRVG